MSTAQEDSPGNFVGIERLPASAGVLRSIGRSSFQGDVYIRPVVAEDLRRDTFALLEDWPEDQPNPFIEAGYTDTEMNYIALTALGLTITEMAEASTVSRSNVKFHLNNIGRKFGNSDKLLIGHLARKAGVLTHVIDATKPVTEARGEPYLAGAKSAMADIMFSEPGENISAGNITEAEREHLGRKVKTGANNSILAKEGHVSEHTVKFHLSNSYRKLGASNQYEAGLILDFAKVGVSVVGSRIKQEMQEASTASVNQKGNVRDIRERNTAYFMRILGIKATQALVDLDKRHKFGTKDPITVAGQLSDRNLGYLEDIGVVTPLMVEQGWVDLPAAILESQLRQPGTAAIVMNSEYQKLAIETATDTARTFIANNPKL